MPFGPSTTTLKECKTKTDTSHQKRAVGVSNSSEPLLSIHNIETIHERSPWKNCVKCLEMTPLISLFDNSNMATSSESPTRFHSELVNTNNLRSMPNELLFRKSSTPPYGEDDVDNPHKGLSALPMRASNAPPLPLLELTNYQRSGWKNIQDSVSWSGNKNRRVLKWTDHTCAVQVCQIATGERSPGRSH